MPPATQPPTQRTGLWRRFAEWGLRRWTRLMDCGPEGRRRSRAQRVFCYILRLSDSFSAHQCSLMACACAYIALLSVVPLLVLGIAALGFLMQSPRHALDLVVGAVGGYAPNRGFLDSTQEILERIFEDRRLIGLFGLGGLLFGAHQIFLAMQPAMNLIWVVPETRHWARQRLIAVVATLYALLLAWRGFGGVRVFSLSAKPPGICFHQSCHVVLSAAWRGLNSHARDYAAARAIVPISAVAGGSLAFGARRGDLVASLLWQATKGRLSVSFCCTPIRTIACTVRSAVLSRWWCGRIIQWRFCCWARK